MTMSMRFPARCRVELTSTDSTKAVAAVSSNGKRRADGAELAALQVATDQICATLALHGAGDTDSRAALERHLASLKVDTKQNSLGRFSGALAFIIGAPAKGSPQFWVYKEEHFHPARVRFTDDKGEWDVRFIDYMSQSTGELFPRMVEVWKGDALQLRLTTQNADPKAKLDDKLF